MTPEASPLLLLILLIVPLMPAAVKSESAATSPESNSGKKFMVVFPENIVYYHPVPSQNKVWITALHPQTTVTIKQPANETNTVLNTETKSFDVKLELGKLNVSDYGISLSNQTIQITSDKDVVVQAFSIRSKSMQTAVVMPTDKLGTKYFIPPIYKIPEAATNVNFIGTDINERSPFRVIIVNTDQNNTVTLQGQATRQVSLQQNHLTQIQVQDQESLQVVEAEKPVAVLFGHPCAARPPCSCGLLNAVLQPARNTTMKFPIPPSLAAGAENQTFVLLSESGSSSAEAFRPDSAAVETSGTAVLYRTDLLLTLIPETDFASCYVVTKISEQHNYVHIVVHKDDKDGIHFGTSPLSLSPEWQELSGTNYTSARLPLSARSTTIWHESSTMAVYYQGEMNGTSFGHPAPVVSFTPDYRGCVLTPEVLEIPEPAGSWQKSITTCSSKGLELVGLWDETLQKHVCSRLSQVDSNTSQEVWIATRRSSATGEWYWLNGQKFQHANWDQGEPGSVDDGQCAVMSLQSKKNCSWSDEECCNAMRPLCYKDPHLLTI